MYEFLFRQKQELAFAEWNAYGGMQTVCLPLILSIFNICAGASAHSGSSLTRWPKQLRNLTPLIWEVRYHAAVLLVAAHRTSHRANETTEMNPGRRCSSSAARMLAMTEIVSWKDKVACVGADEAGARSRQLKAL